MKKFAICFIILYLITELITSLIIGNYNIEFKDTKEKNQIIKTIYNEK